MPNGYQEERDKVRRASRSWGVVWQVGDTLYYLGLFGSILGPILLLGAGIARAETWGFLLRRVGLSALVFLGCFPLGILACGLLKGVAERGAGVK